MKKLLSTLILVLFALSMMAQPFAGHTKHRTATRMSRAQVKFVARGGNLYHHNKKGKVVRNHKVRNAQPFAKK